jgi:glycosyltransferase involved in cell wall biosynthesis
MQNHEKKRILILSYFFPPCSLTASQRAFSWAKLLFNFGYYPVIITRNWNLKISKPEDLHSNCGNEIIHEIHDEYEVFFLPYKSNLRDKLYTKKGGGFSSNIRKSLTFFELIVQNFFLWIIPYRNFYYFSLDYIKKNKSNLYGMIVTANPFVFFKFGYLLHKKTSIKWLADYRDDWNTRENNQWYSTSELLTFIAKPIEINSEKKWLSNASAFISVSDNYVQKIKLFLNMQKGYTIYNGFISQDFEFEFKPKEPNTFVFTYNGTLISIQKIEIFLEAFKNLVQKFENQIKLIVNFVGTGYEIEQETRIREFTIGFEKNVNITKRLSREQAIAIQKTSDILLLVAYGSVKGSPGTKIFDYIALKKPVLLCPSDDDVMEKIMKETNQAIICNNALEMENVFSEIISNYVLGVHINTSINTSASENYSRFSQTKILAKLCDKYFISV